MQLDPARFLFPLRPASLSAGAVVTIGVALAFGLGLAGFGANARAADPPNLAERPRQRETGKAPRTDIHISGVYPHLTTYGVYSQNGANNKEGHEECGIGAVVPWADRLWLVNYAPHMPQGSEHKLYSIDANLKMTIHPESVGGTPAGRMIHRESNQLLIGPYLIDAVGNVRAISPQEMPIRVTAIARHLTDPAHQVYYIDMEGSIWEADVRTLRARKLFSKPVPGVHGKGGYTGQGRLVVSNNGERETGPHPVLPGSGGLLRDDAGVLAEWDGRQWSIVERRQFTDVTGPGGIAGASDADAPLWAIGWDRRSLRLKVLDGGRWHTYLLPKASLCNDARHGWYTEWPRIRQITGGRWMMDMHGMFFDFPPTFSARNSAGIRPISSHLRYVPDFCDWNGRLVLATDETSIQGNRFAGQPQSNLWFGDYADLQTWGPASTYGGPWIDDAVRASVPSDPFLVAGFDRRTLHLAVRGAAAAALTAISGSGNDASSPEQHSIAVEQPPVHFTLQFDVRGDGHWIDDRTVSVPEGGYVCHLLPERLDAVWLRLTADRDCTATAVLHQTSNRFANGSDPENVAMFAGLAEADVRDALGAHVYPAKNNRNLRVLTADQRFFDLTKEGFEYAPADADHKLAKLLEVAPEFAVDAASVIVRNRGQVLRLPRGPAVFDVPFISGWPRAGREVESERYLANIHGTFYEIPLVSNGEPPAFHLLRPVASHARQITDFCSWNGLLVLAGVRANATNDGHVFADARQNVGLWLGGIDDLWKLGKPVGRGGPWKDTRVKAGEPSDPYLLTGYDRKTLHMTADAATTISVEVDFDHQSGWHRYQAIELQPRVVSTFEFPAAFSAHWVRFVSERDCTATAILDYE